MGSLTSGNIDLGGSCLQELLGKPVALYLELVEQSGYWSLSVVTNTPAKLKKPRVLWETKLGHQSCCWEKRSWALLSTCGLGHPGSI